MSTRVNISIKSDTANKLKAMHPNPDNVGWNDLIEYAIGNRPVTGNREVTASPPKGDSESVKIDTSSFATKQELTNLKDKFADVLQNIIKLNNLKSK